MSHIINFHTFGYSPQDIPCPDVYLDKLFVILTIPADLCQIQFRYKQLEIPIEAIAITLQPKGEEEPKSGKEKSSLCRRGDDAQTSDEREAPG